MQRKSVATAMLALPRAWSPWAAAPAEASYTRAATGEFSVVSSSKLSTVLFTAFKICFFSGQADFFQKIDVFIPNCDQH